MPELVISLSEEQLLDARAAAGMRGESAEAFALRVVSGEADGLLRDPSGVLEFVSLDDVALDLILCTDSEHGRPALVIALRGGAPGQDETEEEGGGARA